MQLKQGCGGRVNKKHFQRESGIDVEGVKCKGRFRFDFVCRQSNFFFFKASLIVTSFLKNALVPPFPLE